MEPYCVGPRFIGVDAKILRPYNKFPILSFMDSNTSET
jgi:hypothetical protein